MSPQLFSSVTTEPVSHSHFGFSVSRLVTSFFLSSWKVTLACAKQVSCAATSYHLWFLKMNFLECPPLLVLGVPLRRCSFLSQGMLMYSLFFIQKQIIIHSTKAIYFRLQECHCAVECKISSWSIGKINQARFKSSANSHSLPHANAAVALTLKENRHKVTDVLEMCPLRPSLSYSSDLCSLSAKAIHCVFMVSLRASSSHQTKTRHWRSLSFQLVKAWGWDPHHPASHLPMPSEKSEPLPPYKGLQPSSRLEVTLCYRANRKSFTPFRPKQDSLEVNLRAIRLELDRCASRTFPGTACIIAKHNTRSALMISLLNNSVIPFS